MPATTSEARPAMYTADNHQPRALDVAYRTALSNLVAPYGYFFYDPADVGNLISGSSAFSKCVEYTYIYICDKYTYLQIFYVLSY